MGDDSSEVARGKMGLRVVIVIAVLVPVAAYTGLKATGEATLTDGSPVLIPVLFGTLLFWGHWPVLRRMSTFSTVSFVSTMILVQCCWVLAAAALFAESGDLVGDAIKAFGTSSGCLALLAGLSLGFGDCGIAYAIEAVGVGIGPPIIFTTNIVFGSSIDYALSTSESSCQGAILATSVIIAVCGIGCNTLASAGGAPEKAVEEPDFVKADSPLIAKLRDDDAPKPDSPYVVKRRCVELGGCMLVGIFSGGWSPLLTAAADRLPSSDGQHVLWELYALFQLGEGLALLLLVLGRTAVRGVYVEGVSAFQPPALGELTRRLKQTVALGLMHEDGLGAPMATGIVIGSGFICYFLSTTAGVSSATSYALGSCCSLVAMAYSYFIFLEFKNANRARVTAFKAAFSAYAVAIILLFSTPVLC